MSFLLGRPRARCYVSFWECIFWQTDLGFPGLAMKSKMSWVATDKYERMWPAGGLRGDMPFFFGNFYVSLKLTASKLAPENGPKRPKRKLTSIQTIHFQVLCLFQGRVCLPKQDAEGSDLGVGCQPATCQVLLPLPSNSHHQENYN